MTGIIKETGRQTDTHTRRLADTSTSHGTPEIASKSPDAEKWHGTDSLSQPQKEPTLLTPWSQTFTLQDSDNKFLFKLPHLQYFVTAALAN